MFNKIRYLLLGTILVFGASINSYALDEFSAIPKEHTELLDNIIKFLNIENVSSESKKSIYLQFEHALKGSWYYKITTADSFKASKFVDNPVQILQLFVVNDERINNISFVYFKNVRQIMVSGSEFVEGSSKAVLDAYKEKKNKSDVEVRTDGDIFAVTQEKGRLDYSIYHMDSPHGMAGYIDYGIINLD